MKKKVAIVSWIKKAVFLGAVSTFCFQTVAYANESIPPSAGLNEKEIDQIVGRARDAFHIPGVAVGIIQDGKITFSKPYGRRAERSQSAAIDAQTLFAIGSNSKQFTTAGLALLVQDGKLKWDDRVTDHIAEFRVSDAWLTREFRVSDLLTHHSGMATGAGDMMLFSHSTYTRPEILAALPYMPFTAPFRSDYAYNNLLYVVAGYLLEKVSGQSWEKFIQTRLIDAAGLQACQSTPPTAMQQDVATGQGDTEERTEQPASPVMSPAGGIWCSLNGVNRWAQILLNNGTTPEGKKILSKDQLETMWQPHGLIPLSESAARTQTHFRAYGYGWFMDDYYGLAACRVGVPFEVARL